MTGWRLTMVRTGVAAVFSAVTLLGGASLAPARPLPFPVPETGAYIGAFAGSGETTLSAFNTTAGKPQTFFMRFAAVGRNPADKGEQPYADFARDCYARGAVPYFTLEPFNATSGSLLTAADVAWIETFAREVGAFHRPVFVRFGHEMNGEWYPWGWGRVTPGVYISGYRRVADIFRREAPEAAMVWAPSQNWGATTDDLYSSWYPGDDYVDWVGLTTYQWPYSGLASNQFVSSIRYGDGAEGDFYTSFAVGHAKPMIVAETACGDDAAAYYDNSCYGTNQDERGVYGTTPGLGAQQWWMHQVYSVGSGSDAVSETFPRIKAISWFSAADTKVGSDFQIGGSSAASHSAGFEVYRELIANPYWVSAIPDPTVHTTRSVDGNLSGWNRENVTLTLEAVGPYAAEPLTTWWWLADGQMAQYAEPLMLSAEGTTSVSFYSRDAVGVREATQTVAIRIDKTPPALADDHLASYDALARVTLWATDALSGVDSLTYSVNGGQPITVSGSSADIETALVGPNSVEYRSIDGAGNESAPQTISFTVVPAPIYRPVYRFFQLKKGSHFYTSDEAEKDYAIDNLSATYQFEGVGFRINTAAPTMTRPLYRFFNVRTGTHFYTATDEERDDVLFRYPELYRYEGVAYSVSGTPSDTPVHRFFNRKAGTHFFTSDETEKSNTITNLSGTFTYEGVGYYIAE